MLTVRVGLAAADAFKALCRCATPDTTPGDAPPMSDSEAGAVLFFFRRLRCFLRLRDDSSPTFAAASAAVVSETLPVAPGWAATSAVAGVACPRVDMSGVACWPPRSEDDCVVEDVPGCELVCPADAGLDVIGAGGGTVLLALAVVTVFSCCCLFSSSSCCTFWACSSARASSSRRAWSSCSRLRTFRFSRLRACARRRFSSCAFSASSSLKSS